MRRIIDGIVYDTETAEKLGETPIYGAWAGDCHIPAKDILYRGRNGGFFYLSILPAPKNWVMKALSGAWKDDFSIYPIKNRSQLRDMAVRAKIAPETLGLEPLKDA